MKNPCWNGGTCTEDQRGDYSCQCPLGYVGLNCEAPIGSHVCETSNPCRNEANCVELDNDDGNYRCECKPGWTGRHCEIDFDDCASSPCKNDGNCTDLSNNFACKCDSTGFVFSLLYFVRSIFSSSFFFFIFFFFITNQ